MGPGSEVAMTEEETDGGQGCGVNRMAGGLRRAQR